MGATPFRPPVSHINHHVRGGRMVARWAFVPFDLVSHAMRWASVIDRMDWHGETNPARAPRHNQSAGDRKAEKHCPHRLQRPERESSVWEGPGPGREQRG